MIEGKVLFVFEPDRFDKKTSGDFCENAAEYSLSTLRRKPHHAAAGADIVVVVSPGGCSRIAKNRYGNRQPAVQVTSETATLTSEMSNGA